MNWSAILSGVIETSIYSAVGVALMGVAFLVLKAVMPFSIRKEIEEDQNISLGIIIGAVMIGIAIIVASVISAPSSQGHHGKDAAADGTPAH